MKQWIADALLGLMALLVIVTMLTLPSKAGQPPEESSLGGQRSACFKLRETGKIRWGAMVDINDPVWESPPKGALPCTKYSTWP